MKVDIGANFVKLDLTNDDAALLNRTPFPVYTTSAREQFARNVVRALGLTPDGRGGSDAHVYGKRGLRNAGFYVIVFIERPGQR